MVTIEQAKNGYILRLDDEETLVFQSEYKSLNHALGALLIYLNNNFTNESDCFRVHIEIKP